MTDLALVIEVLDSSRIKIVPLLQDTCISCTVTTCAKRGRPFYVTNPRGLPVARGSTVKVDSSKRQQLLQALVNLFFPIAIAVCSFLLISRYTSIGDGQAIFLSLGSLFVSGAILFFVAKPKNLAQSEIVAVID